jgi:hypothetical protein
MADSSFDPHHVFLGQGHRTSLLAIPCQVADMDKSTIPISSSQRVHKRLDIYAQSRRFCGERGWFLFPRFFKWL